MISDVGKSVASIKLSDGYVINIFNKTCNDIGANVNFYDEYDSIRYILSADQSSLDNKYRCAYYTRSHANTASDLIPRLVVFIPPNLNFTSADNIPVVPLFELINPVINKFDQDSYFLTWWSNVDNPSLINDGTLLKYVPSAIKKFSTSTLGDITQVTGAAKILCTAPIRWQLLRQQGGGVTTQTEARLTPVVIHPGIVLSIKNQGYITDFSTGGGSGSGLSMHSHTNNNDGGFAASVFMPSASIRPLNWR